MEKNITYIWSRFSWSVNCIKCVGRIQTCICCDTRSDKSEIYWSRLRCRIVENQKLVIVRMAKKLSSNYIFKPVNDFATFLAWISSNTRFVLQILYLYYRFCILNLKNTNQNKILYLKYKSKQKSVFQNTEFCFENKILYFKIQNFVLICIF